jgi:uracil-DNA glycosylase family protein
MAAKAAVTKSARFPGAVPFIPETTSLPVLGQALQLCKGCDLYLHAKQGVMGAGPKKASVFFIGEQPGNDEDLKGSPFVGPAGKLLDRALVDASIDRSQVYVTNAVKHFKFEERGKRRLHKKPNAAEVTACRPWLEEEIALVKPKVIVCLGATASAAVLGRSFRLTKERGIPMEHAWAKFVVATVHPSAILRAPDPPARETAYSELVADLKTIAGLL